MTQTPQTDDSMVAALLRERAGYAGRKGKEDRVEAVDEQLRLRGYSPDGTRIEEQEPETPETPQKPTEPETPQEPQTHADPARTAPPKGRRARRPEQA
ncbi:hypothetical protein AB0H77_03700 [Streptomyces sp. NPDC050844]|uniref:hypothetical protein n=1 Tax=Streptomyces sp. NPDC050844 TaxID=3155790 RepID=UPI0033FF93D0